MNSITTENLSDYRLVKITYEHTLKQFELFERTLDDGDMENIRQAHRYISTRVRKRNTLMDWIWAPSGSIETLTETLDTNSIRYKLIDHTLTYYRTPEKLSALRNEIDTEISKVLTTDFVLDRIGMVGIENITKLERKHIEKESKK